MGNINTYIARYQAAFGYIPSNVNNAVFGRLFNIPVYKPQTVNGGEVEEIQLYEVAEVNFANVVFENLKTKKQYSFGITSPGDTNIYMAPPLMVSFSRDKNVVRTAVDRSETEVIEHFGLKPFTINIQGILIDQETRQHPRELLKAVNEMFGAWGTYKVTGDIFLDLEVYEIFFESNFNVSFVEGYADTVKFSVQAISTFPLELKKKL